MDNAQGKKIYYGIVLDNAQLRQDAEQSKNIFRGIGDASTASASRIDNAYKSVSGTLVKLGAAVSAVELAKGIYNFADRFERSMAEVTTISETVTNNLGKFKQEIIEMSTEIPVPADEAAKALYQIVSAGHDGAAGMEVLRVSAKAAVGGVTETVTAADAITSILNAYKKGAGEAENISDQLFTTVRLGKTTMGELGHSISQAIPIAASFGIESEQVLAAIATLTKSGTPTAQAVTQVRAAVKAASEQLGDGYFKTHTFQQGLQEIATKAGGSEAKLRALVPEIEAMNGILGLTGINAKTAASDLDELMHSAGATETAFQKMARETSYQLTILKNNALAEFSELGESMVENVGKVVAALNEAFDTGKIDKLMRVLGSLIAMYGTYKATLIAISAIERVALLAKQVREYVQMARALGLATANQIAFNRATLLNPYVAAAAAIAAVVGGLVLYCSSADKATQAAAELNKNIDEETQKLDEAYGAIIKAKQGTDDRRTAIEQFNSEYGKYLSNLVDEKSSIDDLIIAYKEAKQAMIDLQIEKARSTYLEEPIEDLTKKTKKFYKQLGDWTKELSTPEQQARFTAYVDQMLEDIKNGGYFNVDKVYDAFRAAQAKQSYPSVDAWKKASRGGQESFGMSNIDIIDLVGGWDVNDIDFLGKDIQRLQGVLNNAESDFERFSATYKEVLNPQSSDSGAGPDNKPLTSIKTEVKETAALIAELKQQIADLRSGKVTPANGSVATAIEAKAKELKEAEARYKLLLGMDDGKTVSRQTKYDEQIRQEAIQRQRAEEDLEFSVQQARIDAMKDGIDKVLAQNELNHKRELLDIERQKQDLLKAIQDQERTIWEAKNPDWEKKGLKFTPKTTELPQDVMELFTAMTTASNAKSVKTNQQALDDMLADFLTYEQSRTKITEEYEKKRKALYEADGKTLKKGVTQGNVDELNRNETEALNAVDEQFAQREETYQAWMNQIANMTLEGLEDALAQAKAALADAEKSGVKGSKLAAAKAKVNSAEKKVTKARAENDVAPNKRSIKEWEDLYKTLQEAEREFESIGDTVDGVAGEIIETAGTIMTSSLSMISSIAQLANWTVISTQMTAQGASKAIQTVEKASVILTVISAAMSIATAIIGLFNNDQKYQEEIEKLQGRIDQLQWELDNADMVRLQANTENALKRVKRIYAETVQEVLKLHATTNRYANVMYQFFGKAIYQSEILQKSAEKLAIAYANIAYTADKALGEKKFDNAKDQLKNIAEQQLLLQEQIKKEDAKKKTDHGKIKDWERQIQELGEEANKIINEIVEEIIGGSAADLAKELGDAFIDAFQAGEDAAEAWRDKVNEIVADVIRRMLVSKFLEEPLGEIFDKYKAKWYKDGGFAGIDEIIASMGGFASDLNSVGNDFKEIWDNLPDSVKNMFTVTGDATREASEKGIATASQESVDDLNGRATAMQGHTYSIMESAKLLVANSSLILMHLAGIETNTKQLARLEHIEDDMKAVKTTVNDIALKGLKLKK